MSKRSMQLYAPIFALSFGLIPGLGAAQEAREFDEAHLFFELNNTDGDLGIHGKIDGGPWTRVTIEGTQ